MCVLCVYVHLDKYIGNILNNIIIAIIRQCVFKKDNSYQQLIYKKPILPL